MPKIGRTNILSEQIYTKEGKEEPIIPKDKDVPYYQSLRGELNLELTRAIKQRNSVYPWPSVGGAMSTVTVQMSPTTEDKQDNKLPRTSSYFAF